MREKWEKIKKTLDNEWNEFEDMRKWFQNIQEYKRMNNIPILNNMMMEVTNKPNIDELDY